MDAIMMAVLAAVVLLLLWYFVARPMAGAKSNFNPKEPIHPPFQYKLPPPPSHRTPAEMAALEERARQRLLKDIEQWRELEAKKAGGKSTFWEGPDLSVRSGPFVPEYLRVN